MKFRGTAVGLLVDGHSVQAFFVSKELADAWAQKTIEKYPDIHVEIYEITERLIETING
jgi:hypothetical protein